MKKIMSLAIAVLFALGITTVAFAADATAPATTTDKTVTEKTTTTEKMAPKKAKKKAKKVKKTTEKTEKTETKEATPRSGKIVIPFKLIRAGASGSDQQHLPLFICIYNIFDGGGIT